jgi:hypothetical protein
MVDGSLSGLNWPLVSFQCDHTPCIKALRDFPISLAYKSRNVKNCLWTFQWSRSAVIGRSRSYRDIANRDFAIPDVEVFCLLDSAIADFSMALSYRDFSDSPDHCHASEQMDGCDLSSQFRDMLCPRPLVSRIREMSNPDMPMKSLIGTFPKASISATRPEQMDG